MTQATQVGQGRALGFLGVSQQTAGGANGQGQAFTTEALEVLGGKLLTEALERRLTFDNPRRWAGCAQPLYRREALRQVIGFKQFGGVETLQFARQRFPALYFKYAEAAAGDVQNRQTNQ